MSIAFTEMTSHPDEGESYKKISSCRSGGIGSIPCAFHFVEHSTVVDLRGEASPYRLTSHLLIAFDPASTRQVLWNGSGKQFGERRKYISYKASGIKLPRIGMQSFEDEKLKRFVFNQAQK